MYSICIDPYVKCYVICTAFIFSLNLQYSLRSMSYYKRCTSVTSCKQMLADVWLMFLPILRITIRIKAVFRSYISLFQNYFYILSYNFNFLTVGTAISMKEFFVDLNYIFWFIGIYMSLRINGKITNTSDIKTFYDCLRVCFLHLYHEVHKTSDFYHPTNIMPIGIISIFALVHFQEHGMMTRK